MHLADSKGTEPPSGKSKVIHAFLLPLLVILAIGALGLWCLSSLVMAPWSVTFHIANSTNNSVDSFVLTDTEGDHEVGPINAGQIRDIKVKTAFHFIYRYRMTINGKLSDGRVTAWGDDDDEGYTRNWDISIEAVKNAAPKIEATPHI